MSDNMTVVLCLWMGWVNKRTGCNCEPSQPYVSAYTCNFIIDTYAYVINRFFFVCFWISSERMQMEEPRINCQNRFAAASLSAQEFKQGIFAVHLILRKFFGSQFCFCVHLLVCARSSPFGTRSLAWLEWQVFFIAIFLHIKQIESRCTTFSISKKIDDERRTKRYPKWNDKGRCNFADLLAKQKRLFSDWLEPGER